MSPQLNRPRLAGRDHKPRPQSSCGRSAGRLEDVQQECAEVDIDAIKCSYE